MAVKTWAPFSNDTISITSSTTKRARSTTKTRSALREKSRGYHRASPTRGYCMSHPKNKAVNNPPLNTMSAPKPTSRARARQSSEPLKDMPCPKGCGQMFRCQHNIDQHIREAHTGERPWVCQICLLKEKLRAGKQQGTFARAGSFYRHMRMVHDIEPDLSGPRRAPVRKRIGVNAVPKCAAAPIVRMGARKKDDGVRRVREECGLGCGETFEDADSALVHYHLAHGVPQDRSCACTLCQNLSIDQMSSDLQQPPTPPSDSHEQAYEAGDLLDQTLDHDTVFGSDGNNDLNNNIDHVFSDVQQQPTPPLDIYPQPDENQSGDFQLKQSAEYHTGFDFDGSNELDDLFQANSSFDHQDFLDEEFVNRM